MIGLARSERIKRILQNARATSALARRYVAGKTAAAGVERARVLLAERGIRSSLFFLGEYVDQLDLVRLNVEQKKAVASALGAARLDVHVSVDPTQIGYSIDPALARSNAFEIAESIRAAAGKTGGFHCLMIDMEDAGVIDASIALHDALRRQGLPTALTLQAYLRRTESDLAAQLCTGAKVRLVKGAFAAGRDIAFTKQAEIKANHRRLIDLMFSPEARESGFYPIVATHDDALHAHAVAQAERHGWPSDSYEFEMLMGVRGDVAATLAAHGHRVRLYVPFGKDWWPYAARRIGENPRNAILLLRSLFGRGDTLPPSARPFAVSA